MSVLIKGVEMPTSCRACMFSRTDIRNVDWCVLTEKDLPCDCPIVPIPPHGRLIDADALMRKKIRSVQSGSGENFTSWTISAVSIENIRNAPTIIESEEEDG